MDLKDEFQKYVGQTIKDPWRFTSDCDAVGDSIYDTAIKGGYIAIFSSLEKPKPELPEDQKYVEVKVEPTGNASSYIVKEFIIN